MVMSLSSDLFSTCSHSPCENCWFIFQLGAASCLCVTLSITTVRVGSWSNSQRENTEVIFDTRTQAQGMFSSRIPTFFSRELWELPWEQINSRDNCYTTDSFNPPTTTTTTISLPPRPASLSPTPLCLLPPRACRGPSRKFSLSSRKQFPSDFWKNALQLR